MHSVLFPTVKTLREIVNPFLKEILIDFGIQFADISIDLKRSWSEIETVIHKVFDSKGAQILRIKIGLKKFKTSESSFGTSVFIKFYEDKASLSQIRTSITQREPIIIAIGPN